MKQLIAVLACIVIVFAPVGAQAQVGHNEAVLNPNRAGADELAGIEGISADLADAIVENRPFLSVLELAELLDAHVTEEQRTAILVSLFVPINLNTASEEEMLLVPGVGDRMAYEFDEYRPYEALARFRREIGKYVDDDELARLEQYVFVPIDLNVASDEDILSIPGFGARMLREFKEYRPYQNIEQFRREIGKYVDEGEVARLERYVKID